MLERQRELIAVGILFLVLTWIAVSLRVYSRGILLKKWGHDDSAMVVTLALFTISIVIQMLAVVHGMGYRHEDLSPQALRTALLYCYLYEIFYILVGVVLKISLGIFYLRIAVERWHVVLIKCIIFGSAGFGLVCLFLVIFQCIPVNTFWTIYPANDRCIPIPAQNGITFTLNALNACTDWILGTLPFFMVRHLNMSFSTKMLVGGILAFAAIGSTGTIVRMKYVKNLTNGPEFLHVVIDVSIWSTVEPGIGITAASIATLRPLLHTVLWRLGLAPAPHYVATRPISSGEGRSGEEYRLDWFRPSHRPPGRVHIENSVSTTITASISSPGVKK
ncbi:hypothetical protein DE146DRAFT_636509 [Phaeosphaeria sp. MPI-PUGE-AT-0046c]|nr:hypothetical protein DE146DRAFT_636509 [Phaeosphaeria sp. MPI-PUGE-AT-0046c]